MTNAPAITPQGSNPHCGLTCRFALFGSALRRTRPRPPRGSTGRTGADSATRHHRILLG